MASVLPPTSACAMRTVAESGAVEGAVTAGGVPAAELVATAAEMPPAAARATPMPAMRIFGFRMVAPDEMWIHEVANWSAGTTETGDARLTGAGFGGPSLRGHAGGAETCLPGLARRQQHDQ